MKIANKIEVRIFTGEIRVSQKPQMLESGEWGKKPKSVSNYPTDFDLLEGRICLVFFLLMLWMSGMVVGKEAGLTEYSSHI